MNAALIAARKNEGLSQRAAAKRMGITADILQRAEQGSHPHLKTAKVIADFYGVKVTDIWPVEDPGDDGERAAA